MKNKPAFPQLPAMNLSPQDSMGLTKIEYACIKLKVPKSGIEELDNLIKESNRNDFAGQAMQGFAGNSHVVQEKQASDITMAKASINLAKELIKQLDTKNAKHT